jgi:hypothetical protein
MLDTIRQRLSPDRLVQKKLMLVQAHMKHGELAKDATVDWLEK